MCGIFGAVNYRIEKDMIIRCLDSIAHRGPDGWGVYQKDRIALGHRRLSILDLSENGKQPMEYLNGRYVITYNGEVYNFIEIRKELEKKGYKFRSNSDTEVILASYVEWKEKCLDRFNGMWAFAIWDNEEKELFLARDRFGIKPLFYTKLNRGYGFASEMKALTPIMPSKTINYKLINNLRIFEYEATSECLIQEIKRLPAGSYAYIKDESIEIIRWWNTLDHLPTVPQNYDEQVEMLRELFLDSCRIRMRSDVTLGTALSGGLDSSATICAMSHIARESKTERINNDWQHAYAATFPGTVLDESVYAKKVTDFLGIESTFLNINPAKFVGKLDKYLYDFEEIYLTSPIPMMVTYDEIKKGGSTVTIDGHGADELFGGYASDFFAAFPDTRFDKKKIKDILSVYNGTFPHDESNLSRPVSKNEYQYYMKYMLNYGIKKPLKRLSIYKATDMKHENWDRLDYFNKILYMHTHQDILPTLLRNYDRYSMAGSVEIRMPFMDYRIVTFAFALGWNAKLRNGFSKAIIRDALKPFMPEEIVTRKTKIGFNTPIVEWMQGPLKEYFEDIVTSNEFHDSNLIDSKKVKEEVLRVIQGGDTIKYLDGENAWKLISPYLWEESFYKKIC